MILGDMFSGDDVPQRQVADLPPDAKGIIEGDYKKAMEPIENQYGVIDNVQASPIVGDIDQAIKQKYQGLVGNRLENFRSGEKINARSKQLSRIKTAQNSLAAKAAVSADIYAKNLENQRMLEAARAEALSSILGFGGTMAGMAAASNGQKKATKVDFGDSPMEIKGSVKGQRGDRESLNDAPGMTRSMNYLADIEEKYDA